MNWTTEKPTAPGWYWAKWRPHPSVKDYTHDRTPFIVKIDGYARTLGDCDPFDLCYLGQFAGPIPMPRFMTEDDIVTY
jgi:hypothetical protein